MTFMVLSPDMWIAVTAFIKVANIALGFVGQKELIRRDFYGFFVFWFI